MQSISSVTEIADCECFHMFLKSGVKSLKEAHVVLSNPQKAKRRSFLGIVKAPVAEDVQKAEVRITNNLAASRSMIGTQTMHDFSLTYTCQHLTAY